MSAPDPEPTGSDRPGAPDPAELADRVVAAVEAARAHPDADVEANVLVARRRHGLTRFANSFIHQHVGEDTTTVMLTLGIDGRTTSASTTATGPDALARLVDDAIRAARLQPVDPSWPGATPPADVPATTDADAETDQGDPATRARGVAAFVGAGPELAAAGYLDTEGTRAAFASTAGQRTRGHATRATIDGIHQTASSAGSGHQTSHRIGDLDPAAAGARAADRARRSAGFTDLDPGELEVVLGPEAVATMLLFLGVYGFNAKTHLEGASFARIGEAQFDPSVTIVDDPRDPRAIGLGFDAQGSPRRTTVLVDAGTTAALVHDRRTARRAGTTTTGNAMPGGESFGAVPMSTILRPGTTTPEEMVADVRRGLLVTQFHYCRVLDPKTQVVTGLTRNGTFLIEDGRIAGAVGNLRFTQSFTDALAPGNVRAVGDDDRFADAEFGPGMVVAPSLQLARFTFTGGSRG